VRADEHPEGGGIEERHPEEVDHKRARPTIDGCIKPIPELRCGGHIDLAGHRHQRVPVAVLIDYVEHLIHIVLLAVRRARFRFFTLSGIGDPPRLVLLSWVFLLNLAV
jgi:hypothetical protein